MPIDTLKAARRLLEERLTVRFVRAAEERGSLEEKHSATIRTVVGAVAAVGAVLAVVIPLAIDLMD